MLLKEITEPCIVKSSDTYFEWIIRVYPEMDYTCMYMRKRGDDWRRGSAHVSHVKKAHDGHEVTAMWLTTEDFIADNFALVL